MASSERKLAIIIGASVAIHGAIAVWALLGDPPEERPVLAATSGRVFVPDVAAELVFTADTMPDFSALAPPVPVPVAPKPAAAMPAPAPAPAIARRPAARLPEAAPKNVVDGLFADDHGLAPAGDVSRRRPGADLQKQIDDARRHGGAATIDGHDPRPHGDAIARIGTAPDCGCDPNTAPVVTPVRHPEVPPPVIKVDPHGPAPTTLTPDDVLRIVTTKYMKGLERCQVELMRRDGDASGRVTIALTIGADGATSEAAAAGLDDGLDRCIEARAGGWRFPSPHDPQSGAAVSGRYQLSLALQAQ